MIWLREVRRRDEKYWLLWLYSEFPEELAAEESPHLRGPVARHRVAQLLSAQFLKGPPVLPEYKKNYSEKNIIAVKNVPPSQKNICVYAKYFLKFNANLNLDLVEENICKD